MEDEKQGRAIALTGGLLSHSSPSFQEGLQDRWFSCSRHLPQVSHGRPVVVSRKLADGQSTTSRTFKVGDIVDIVVNAAEQKGMPHKSQVNSFPFASPSWC